MAEPISKHWESDELITSEDLNRIENSVEPVFNIVKVIAEAYNVDTVDGDTSAFTISLPLSVNDIMSIINEGKWIQCDLRESFMNEEYHNLRDLYSYELHNNGASATVQLGKYGDTYAFYTEDLSASPIYSTSTAYIEFLNTDITLSDQPASLVFSDESYKDYPIDKFVINVASLDYLHSVFLYRRSDEDGRLVFTDQVDNPACKITCDSNLENWVFTSFFYPEEGSPIVCPGSYRVRIGSIFDNSAE